MAVSECPSCTFHIILPPNMEEGMTMNCPDCGALIKLVKIFPPVFRLVGEEQ